MDKTGENREMSVSKEVFCEIMVIAYEINCHHPDWGMDKCIEQAVKGAYNLTDLQSDKFISQQTKATKP